MNQVVFPTKLHLFCRCYIEPVTVIVAGTATVNGQKGADYWMKHYGRLPEYYISKEDLIALGWKQGEAPANWAPGRMASGGIYYNDDGHLPSAKGRVWFEADINYTNGKRNSCRILYSNDGLIFITYDHYTTFYEIV